MRWKDWILGCKSWESGGIGSNDGGSWVGEGRIGRGGPRDKPGPLYNLG